MNKLRQILAIIGIILLVALYGLTLLAAIFDNSKTMAYFTASIAASILLPVTLWLLNLMIQNRKKNSKK